MTGMKFGQWKVIRYSGSSRWMCKCSGCGTHQKVIAWNLWSGHTSRCNYCREKELRKHGHAIIGKVSPTYHSWYGMWRRCIDPNHISYKNYGARGISVCRRWKSFNNFLEDMGEKPIGMVIDRKNNDGDYTPKNCRWTTYQRNAWNKSNTRLALYRGRKMPLTRIEQITGRCRGALFQFLKRYNWPPIDLKLLPNPIPRNFLKQYAK